MNGSSTHQGRNGGRVGVGGGGGRVEKLCYMILTALSSLSLLGSSSNVRRHEALAIELISILQIGNSETSTSGTFQACYLADQQRMFLKGSTLPSCRVVLQTLVKLF